MRKVVREIAKEYSMEEIRTAIIHHICKVNRITKSENYLINKYLMMHASDSLLEKLCKENIGLDEAEFLFEALVDITKKKETGVVFTPSYLVKYIFQNTIKEYSEDMKILDPSCGCGAFLKYSVVELSKQLQKPIVDIIQNNIFGYDINEENIYNLKIILSLLATCFGEDVAEIKFNLYVVDTLDRIQTPSIYFDYIIGNPPYVNPHDLSIETQSILREHYETTQFGTFNIFYAFIERGMELLKETGELGFITPNNWLVIEAASPLRNYLKNNKYINKVIDFGSNVPFNPIKTYNTIIFLNKKKNDVIDYAKLKYSNNIEKELDNIETSKIYLSDLSTDSWAMLTFSELSNIKKIESQWLPLNDYIRTGIATLSDKLYTLSMEEKKEGYYAKEYMSEEYYIEKEIVRKLIKISNHASSDEIKLSKMGIIFPYKTYSDDYSVIDIDTMKEAYPETYRYLKAIKEELAKRNKGNLNLKNWYEYGRSQSLNNLGPKIVFPTFAKHPRFINVKDENALICNGYAIYTKYIPVYSENTTVLNKILNSSIMDYYIKHTSYSIEGDFKCYQKKYLKKFTLPYLSDEDMEYLTKECSVDKINSFLWDKYELE